MIDLGKFRKSLGSAGKNLSNQKLESLLQLQYKLANTLFDFWSKKDYQIIHKETTLKSTVIIHKKNGDACTVRISFFE